MARHRHTGSRKFRRGALSKAGLTVTAAGAAVFGMGAAAQAAPPPLPAPVTTLAGSDAAAVLGATTHAVDPLTTLRSDPLAGTGVAPLDDGLDTRAADVEPVGTKRVTGPVTNGGAVEDPPVAGEAAGLLPR
ncbi:hypothetical protein ACF05T_10565 [Streptomyces lateritius]|uniref:ATP-binding protein n=1 Tax=Streptomyces lateritius TaxID=67313 RepID=A0ABW6Y9M9_9ACTN